MFELVNEDLCMALANPCFPVPWEHAHSIWGLSEAQSTNSTESFWKWHFKGSQRKERLVWGFLRVLNFSQLLLSLNSWRCDGDTSVAPCWKKRNDLFPIYSLQLSFLPYALKTGFVIYKGGNWQGKFFRNKLLPPSGQGQEDPLVPSGPGSSSAAYFGTCLALRPTSVCRPLIHGYCTQVLLSLSARCECTFLGRIWHPNTISCQ